MRLVLCVGFALLESTAESAAAPGLKPPLPKAPPLVGDWEPVRDGPVPPPASPLRTITFTPDGKLKYDVGRGEPEWGWYKLDISKDPPQIDFASPAVAAHPDRRKPSLGIYRLDGDVLSIYSTEGDRPASFEAAVRADIRPLRYRRVKKD